MKAPARQLLCGFAFFVAVTAATCFPMLLGLILWPRGLSACTEMLFWPGTAVAVAGLLLLGGRYWPSILLGVFVAVAAIRRDFQTAFIDSIGNALEALAAWWLLVKVGGFTGTFDRWKTVGLLLLAATLAPFLSAVPGVLEMISRGRISPPEAPAALGVWVLANGSAMLLLTPFLVALRTRGWSLIARPAEAALWLSGGIVLGAWAFDAVFQARAANIAFLVFPFVIYGAVRFGPPETAAGLTLVTASVYAAMARHARTLDPTITIETIWFMQAFCFVLAATGLTVAAMVCERRSAEVRALEESKHALEITLLAERARLKALRYQINPHFLFNTLNSLRATLPHVADTSRDMVTNIAEYFRSVLARPDQDTAPLCDEIESMRRYLAIEETRFEENLQCIFEIDPSTELERVPIFLLQPLVENAIRHGFTHSAPPFHVKIRAWREDSRLQLEVANTGRWREPGNVPQPGLGLENIRERLRLLYGTKAGLEIKSSDGWVRMHVTLPIAITTENPACVA